MIESQSQIQNQQLKQHQQQQYISTRRIVTIAPGNIVTYVIRIYNEGNIDGYADEITEHLPQELEFVNNDFNANKMDGYQMQMTQHKNIKTTLISERQEYNKGLIINH